LARQLVGTRRSSQLSQSSTEAVAEYMALSMAASEAVWLKGIYRELVPDADDIMAICCDNKGAIDLAKNPEYRPRTYRFNIISSEI